MNTVLLIQSLIGGIIMGSVYALLGVGFSLTWGVMKVINISHAAFGLLGAFIAYMLLTWWGIDPILSVAVTAPGRPRRPWHTHARPASRASRSI